MNKTLYSIFFCSLILVQVACGQTQLSDSETKTSSTNAENIKSGYPNLMTQAEEVGKATVEGNFAKLVDYTYPKIVEKFGGKDKMVAFLNNDSAQMKTDGFELERITIGEVKQIAKIENEIFAIVLMTMTIKSPNGKALGESSFVAISNDNGENWKFINGINQDRFKAVFPKAAEKIQIPAEQLPKPIEND